MVKTRTLPRNGAGHAKDLSKETTHVFPQITFKKTELDRNRKTVH